MNDADSKREVVLWRRCCPLLAISNEVVENTYLGEGESPSALRLNILLGMVRSTIDVGCQRPGTSFPPIFRSVVVASAADLSPKRLRELKRKMEPCDVRAPAAIFVNNKSRNGEITTLLQPIRERNLSSINGELFQGQSFVMLAPNRSLKYQAQFRVLAKVLGSAFPQNNPEKQFIIPCPRGSFSTGVSPGAFGRDNAFAKHIAEQWERLHAQLRKQAEIASS